MQEQLEKRLSELKAEYDSGQKIIADLEARQADARTTMLRISGAIQVLEELLSQKMDGESIPGKSEESEVEKVAST